MSLRLYPGSIWSRRYRLTLLFTSAFHRMRVVSDAKNSVAKA